MKKWCLRLLLLSLLCISGSGYLFIRGALFAWQETPLAHIHISQLDQDQAFIRFVDQHGRETAGEVIGTHWQIDAWLVLWHDTLLKLGVKPVVKLVAVHGRDMHDEGRRQFSPRLTLEESDSVSSWLWHLLAHRESIPGVRAIFGTAVFMPLHSGSYKLVLKGNGLVLLPLETNKKAA